MELHWKKLFDFVPSDVEGQRIVEKADILKFLINNQYNAKLFGLLPATRSKIMYTSVSSIEILQHEYIVSFNWFEPTGEYLGTINFNVCAIAAICPFGSSYVGDDSILGKMNQYLSMVLN